MRAFLMCAVLAVAVFTVSTTSAQAYGRYYGHGYYGRPAVIVAPPAPIIGYPPPVVFAPAPIVVTRPAYAVPTYARGPVIVQPAIRPIISLRFGR